MRAFFRLFRYTSSNLIFADNTGYRFHDAGSNVKVPLLGFSAPTSGDVISIPFFAVPRTAYTSDMKTQPEDTPNVQSFPSGSSADQVLYFGAYLDINQDSARFSPLCALPEQKLNRLACHEQAQQIAHCFKVPARNQKPR